MPFGPQYSELPLSAATSTRPATRFVDENAWNTLLGNFSLWKANINAGGYSLSNVASVNVNGPVVSPRLDAQHPTLAIISTYVTSAPSDQKRWDLLAGVDSLAIRCVNDAYTNAGVAWIADRGTGMTIESQRFYTDGLKLTLPSASTRGIIVNGFVESSGVYASGDTLDLSSGTTFATTGASVALRRNTSSYNPDGIEMYAGGMERLRIGSNGFIGFSHGTPKTMLTLPMYQMMSYAGPNGAFTANVWFDGATAQWRYYQNGQGYVMKFEDYGPAAGYHFYVAPTNAAGADAVAPLSDALWLKHDRSVHFPTAAGGWVMIGDYLADVHKLILNHEGVLGPTPGTTQQLFKMRVNSGNDDRMDLVAFRYGSGSGWGTARWRQRRMVDGITSSFIDFVQWGTVFGVGNSGLEVASVTTEGLTLPGTWDTPLLILRGHRLWIDDSGRLRIKNGAPSGQSDGSLVGLQS